MGKRFKNSNDFDLFVSTEKMFHSIDMFTLSLLYFTEYQYICKGTGFPFKTANVYNIFREERTCKLIWITVFISTCMSSMSEPIQKTTSTRISAYRLCQLEDWRLFGIRGFNKEKVQIYRKKCKNNRKSEIFTEKSVGIKKKGNILQKKCAKS